MTKTMFLSIKDLSQYLHIKPSTLYAWASKGIIPHYKVHGLLRFKQDEIDAWIASFRKEKLAPHIPLFKRRDQDDIDSLIERAKREVYNFPLRETGPIRGQKGGG